MPGGDTTKKRWTEHELAMAANGMTPPGRTASQATQMRAKLKRMGVAVRHGDRCRSWSTAEDLEVMAGATPKGHTQEEAERRRRWLQANFVDVGWGSLIGTQPIYEG